MKLENFLIAILLPVVCIYDQAQSVYSIPNNDLVKNSVGSKSRAGLDDDVLMNLTDKLEKNVEQPLHKTLQLLIQTIQKPKEIAFSFLKDFEDELQEETQELVNIIIETHENASKINTDVAKCINDSIEEISSLPKYALDVTTKCVTYRVLEAEDLILGTISSINASYARVKDIWRELKDCNGGRSIKKTVCIAILTAKVNSVVEDMPAEITKAAAKVTEYSPATFIPFLAVCTEGQIDNIHKQGENVLSDVNQCVSDTFSNNSSNEENLTNPQSSKGPMRDELKRVSETRKVIKDLDDEMEDELIGSYPSSKVSSKENQNPDDDDLMRLYKPQMDEYLDGNEGNQRAGLPFNSRRKKKARTLDKKNRTRVLSPCNSSEINSSTFNIKYVVVLIIWFI